MTYGHASHQTVRLDSGKHASPDHGVCVMELASMLAHEPFSDHPEAVCPVIAAFLRAYNDKLADEPREELYEYVCRVVGTSGRRSDRSARLRLCAEWVESLGQAPRFSWLWSRGSWWCAPAAGRLAAQRGDEGLEFLDRLIEAGPPGSGSIPAYVPVAATTTGAEDRLQELPLH